MAGIYVLSDTLKVGSKLEKAPALKEIDVVDNSENSAAVFAAMLSGSINQKADSKGQYAALVGKKSEKKQSTEDSVQSAQNPNELGSMLGYGSFVLPLLTQPMYQGDLPAGKEANSGNDDEVSVQSGMTAQKPQGDNPGITELDKYRQVIGNLLGALSGEITNTSGKGIPSNTESRGTKGLSQDIAKVVQGWSTLSDNEANSSQASTGQKGIQTTNVLTSGPSTVKPLNEKDITPLKAPNPILNQEVKDATMPQGVLNKEIYKGELTRSSEPYVTKVVQNQSSSVGIGVGVPSNMDIQLHLADLREIQIDLNTSGKGILSNTESRGTQDLSPDIAKVVQGWSTLSVNEANTSQASTGQKGIQTTNALTIAPSTIKTLNEPLNEKDLTPLKAPNPILNQEVKDATMPQGVLNKEIHKGELTRPSEPSVTKVVQNQSSSVGIEVGVGVPSNIVVSNVAEGKMIAAPVWEQISTVLREQVMNRSQDLKQLDIQLHPADLGKIQIDLRWENGQVHLQVHASQVSTGQLLQDHLSDLRQALSNQGVNCGMLQMGQGGARQQSPQGDGSRRTFTQNIPLDEDEDQSSDTTSLSMGLPGINRINLTA